MDNINLIRFNDDNHAERFFINGEYVGCLSDTAHLIKNIIDRARELNDDYKFTETEVYVCDDFDDFDDYDELVDNIWEFFNSCGQMTDEQIQAIQEKDWQKLNDLI